MRNCRGFFWFVCEEIWEILMINTLMQLQLQQRFSPEDTRIFLLWLCFHMHILCPPPSINNWWNMVKNRQNKYQGDSWRMGGLPCLLLLCWCLSDAVGASRKVSWWAVRMRPGQTTLPAPAAAAAALLFLLSGLALTSGCNKALCASDVSKCLIQVKRTFEPAEPAQVCLPASKTHTHTHTLKYGSN